MIKSLSIRNIATFNNDGININNLNKLILYMELMVQVKVQLVKPSQI